MGMKRNFYETIRNEVSMSNKDNFFTPEGKAATVRLLVRPGDTDGFPGNFRDIFSGSHSVSIPATPETVRLYESEMRKAKRNEALFGTPERMMEAVFGKGK